MANLPDLLFVLLSILFVLTVTAAVEYYRQLRRAKREYEKAKGAVEDIVLSFNRQLRREAEKLEAVAYKVEAHASRDDGAHKRMEEIGRKVNSLEMTMSSDLQNMETMANQLDQVGKQARDVVASQERSVTRITSLEEQVNRLSVAPEVSLEGVMPIKREKAMAHLTETQISVLEMLASEGAKTAPEIKERVKLSREHTARLMKKLYEEGYLERETNKIPFKYSVKKEMEKLLKKTESEPA
jgi:predicted ArsR family transcriptional regulator